jgi:hypothetical protein
MMEKQENEAEKAIEDTEQEDQFFTDLNAQIQEEVFDKDLQKEVDRLVEYVDRRFGLRALDKEESYEEGNLIEEIIHFMRWDPEFLFDCEIKKLHEYEMALAAHIAFVRARSNHWQVMCDMADRDLDRAVRLASNHFTHISTLKERSATAMKKFPALRNKEKQIDVYRLYKQKCHGMVEVFVQMDNSLKKTLDRRKYEHTQ